MEPQPEKPTTTRKPYRTPRIDVYGQVNELTRTSVAYSLAYDTGPFQYQSLA